MIPGVQVFLEKSSNPARKTAYDLVCVNKGGRLINMDSQIPNKAALEWVKAGHLFPEEVAGNCLRKLMEIPDLICMPVQIRERLLLRSRV